MSQHYLEAKKAEPCSVTVLMGWDRPLQFYHCTVFDNSQDEQPLYSSLDDGIPFRKRVDPEYYCSLINDRFGTTIPDAMLEAIYEDRRTNAGNRVEYYSA